MFQSLGGMAAYQASLAAAIQVLSLIRRNAQAPFWHGNWKQQRRRGWKRRRSSGLYQ